MDNKQKIRYQLTSYVKFATDNGFMHLRNESFINVNVANTKSEGE